MTDDLPPPLGSTVWQTYELLTSPRTTRELAALRGLTQGTIRRHLAKLHAHGLVGTISKSGARYVWDRSDHDISDDGRPAHRHSPALATQTRTTLVADSTQQPTRHPTEPEPQPRPEPQPHRDRNLVLLGIVGVLIAAGVIAVALEKQNSSSFDRTPTAAAASPSVPDTAARAHTDDVPHRGSVTIGGRTFTQERARGYLAQLRQGLDTSDTDSDLLSIGAGICTDLDAGSTRDQEVDALQVVLNVKPVEAGLYYSVAVGELCAEDLPIAASDTR